MVEDEIRSTGFYDLSNKERKREGFYNSQGNNVSLHDNGKTFYFSYDTLIAVKDNENRDTFIRENDWSNTTGKHLNEVSRDKSIRCNESLFNAKIAQSIVNKK